MKRKPVGSDHDKWLHAMLRQEPAKRSDVCLDADTIAAWADGSLAGVELAAAELHASTCSRCMAILAATERAAPPATGVSKRPWILVSPMRWLVPLTAAATAVAIWVVVPDRPVTVAPVARTDSPQMSAGSTQTSPEAPTEMQARSADSYAPGPRTNEPGTTADRGQGLRDESRRERVAQETAQLQEKTAEPSPPPPAVAEFARPPEAAAPSAAAPSAAPAQARDSSAELKSTARQLNRTLAANESLSASNALNRWRIVVGTSVERSTDGGKTWTRTSPLPESTAGSSAVTTAAVRAVDASRAVVSTSDGRVFYTTDAGKSWTRVQENQTAPF